MTTAEFESKIAAALSELNIDRNAKIGVALSGGADSVALLTALSRLKYNVTALHCDFSLRGEESDADRHYCVELTEQSGIALQQVKFDTNNERQSGESLEMACRRLRYDWFEQQAKDLSLNYIALGHHCEDSIETMLLNLTRGTGPKGLSGIAAQRDIYIRPMLRLSRRDIEDYLLALNIGWRTDSTNLTNDYRRNALRNQLIPQLYDIIPTAQAGLLRTAEAMSHSTRMLSTYIDWCADRFFKDGKLRVGSLREEEGIDIEGTLYMLIPRVFGCEVSMEVVKQILAEPDKNASRLFPASDGQQLELYLGKLEIYFAGDNLEFEVTLDDHIYYPINIFVHKREYDAENFKYSPKTRFKLFLDGSIFDEPHKFKLRHRRPGDKMRPFGASGQRLISDIFSDLKMSQSERNRAYILTIDDKPLWIIGIRAAEMYRVTENSKNFVYLKYVNLHAEIEY